MYHAIKWFFQIKYSNCFIKIHNHKFYLFIHSSSFPPISMHPLEYLKIFTFSSSLWWIKGRKFECLLHYIFAKSKNFTFFFIFLYFFVGFFIFLIFFFRVGFIFILIFERIQSWKIDFCRYKFVANQNKGHFQWEIPLIVLALFSYPIFFILFVTKPSQKLVKCHWMLTHFLKACLPLWMNWTRKPCEICLNRNVSRCYWAPFFIFIRLQLINDVCVVWSWLCEPIFWILCKIFKMFASFYGLFCAK